MRQDQYVKWCLALCSALIIGLWMFSCTDDGPNYIESDADLDADSDADSDSDSDADSDADSDDDADQEVEQCTEESTFCLDNQIHRCAEDGNGTVLMQDCTVSPFYECVEALCSPGATTAHPCCISSEEPLCTSHIEVVDEDPLDISYFGTWADGYSCAGYILDGVEFIFRVDSEVLICQEGFLRIVIQGELADLVFDEPQDICEGGVSKFRISLSIAEYDAKDDTWVMANYSANNCENASGTLTLTSWGITSGETFGLSADLTLYEDIVGTTRSMVFNGSGSVVLSE